MVLYRADLPPEVQEHDEGDLEEPHRDGVYVVFYPDGQVKSLTAYRSGHPARSLELEHGVESGSDSGGSAASFTYRPERTIESFSAWDDDSPPQPTDLSCRDWALAALTEMLSEHPSPGLTLLYRPGWEQCDVPFHSRAWDDQDSHWRQEIRIAGRACALKVLGGLTDGYRPWLGAFRDVGEVSGEDIAQALGGTWEGSECLRVGKHRLRVKSRALRRGERNCLFLTVAPDGERPKTWESLEAMIESARF